MVSHRPTPLNALRFASQVAVSPEPIASRPSTTPHRESVASDWLIGCLAAYRYRHSKDFF